MPAISTHSTRISFLILFFISVFLTSCHVGRYFVRNTAGTTDYRFFPSTSIKGNPQAVTYESTRQTDAVTSDQLPSQINPEFLRETRTTSFIILISDSIFFEWYGEGYDASSITSSFSVSKSVVSSLVGIAIAEGKISSLDEPVSTYLGANLHPSLAGLSFRHLLDMRAGLNFRERYLSPFSPMARYYYGRHLERYSRKLKAERELGSEYEYQSAATQLAGMALEKATGQDIADYLSEKIWLPAGMGSGASWSLDREGGEQKFFCCLNASPMDYVRFGQLFMDGGRYGDKQILPQKWVESISHVANDSRDSQGYPYHLGWRITPGGGIFAKGILGQYIYVNTENRMVIVRTGKSSKGLDWGKMFDAIAQFKDR